MSYGVEISQAMDSTPVSTIFDYFLLVYVTPFLSLCLRGIIGALKRDLGCHSSYQQPWKKLYSTLI